MCVRTQHVPVYSRWQENHPYTSNPLAARDGAVLRSAATPPYHILLTDEKSMNARSRQKRAEAVWLGVRRRHTTQVDNYPF